MSWLYGSASKVWGLGVLIKWRSAWLRRTWLKITGSRARITGAGACSVWRDNRFVNAAYTFFIRRILSGRCGYVLEMSTVTLVMQGTDPIDAKIEPDDLNTPPHPSTIGTVWKKNLDTQNYALKWIVIFHFWLHFGRTWYQPKYRVQRQKWNATVWRVITMRHVISHKQWGLDANIQLRKHAQNSLCKVIGQWTAEKAGQKPLNSTFDSLFGYLCTE